MCVYVCLCVCVCECLQTIVCASSSSALSFYPLKSNFSCLVTSTMQLTLPATDISYCQSTVVYSSGLFQLVFSLYKTGVQRDLSAPFLLSVVLILGGIKTQTLPFSPLLFCVSGVKCWINVDFVLAGVKVAALAGVWCCREPERLSHRSESFHLSISRKQTARKRSVPKCALSFRLPIFTMIWPQVQYAFVVPAQTSRLYGYFRGIFYYGVIISLFLTVLTPLLHVSVWDEW